MTTYREALEYLYSAADFERTGRFRAGAEENLGRMARLLALLGDPHRSYGTTHIAGTKGKGSTAKLIAAGLTASRVRTGLYTSPDLHAFRERIQIDGVPVSKTDLAAFVDEVRAAVERMDPHDAGSIITFDLATALAFLTFARRGVRHAAIEVGLGGRLDPTNIILPLVGVITSISLDHTAILGDTVAAIAGEKAGIIKPGMAVVSAAQDPDAADVIASTCMERGARLVRVGPAGRGTDYEYEYDPWPANHPPARTPDELVPPPFTVRGPTGTREVRIAMLGAVQRENAAAALAALDTLAARGVPVTEAGIRAGFASARWPARFDVVGAKPWLVVDGAHNADSLAKLLAALPATLAFDRLHLVLGIMRDKDLAGMAEAVRAAPLRLGSLALTQGTSPRALTPDELADAISPGPDVPIERAAQPGDAMIAALAHAGVDDAVCVTGSLHLAGAALRWVAANLPGQLARHIEIAGNDHD